MFRKLKDFFDDLKNYQGHPLGDNVFIISTGRDEFKYTEGERALLVQCEMLTGKTNRIIYSSTIKKWLPPHESDVVTEKDRERILANICRYFDAVQVTYEVD